DPEVARTLSSLGGLYREQGRYAEAGPLYQRALVIVESALGPDHIRLALPMAGLAALYNAPGRYRDAQTLYGRTLAIPERAPPPAHPARGGRLHDLGGL